MSVSREYESDLTNFGTWVHDFGDKIYRYWVYKRRFTPYEQDKKFTDESLYEDDYAAYGYIKDAIELPDGDILIGFVYPDMETEYVEYYKLSEIRLAYCEDDQDMFKDGDGNEYECLNNVTIEELYGTKETYDKLMGVGNEGNYS